MGTTREQFKLFENKALNKSSVKTYEFDTQRKRKRILHHDEEPDEILDITGSEHFKRNTFLVIIDQLRCELIKNCICTIQSTICCDIENKSAHHRRIGRSGKDSI